jgi:hypothetical protein
MGQPLVRHSTHIGYKAAQTLYYAVGEQAERIGLPLTQFITINFSMTAIAPADATKAFQTLRRSYFNKWTTRPCQGAGPAWVPTYTYVFENERDNEAFDLIALDAPHNVHVHWLAHVPAVRLHDFKMRLSGWLDAISGSFNPAGAIDVRPVNNEKGLRPYGLKGTDKAWAAHFGVEHAPQGLIIGRRSGTSINLGPKARLALDRQLGIRRKAA